MKTIFVDYQNQIITGDSKLKDEYASRKGVNPAWVSCEDITITELINSILDEFEEAGFDLNILPMENILDRFMSFEPKTVIPEEYTQLMNAKTMIENQIASTKETEYTIDIISTMNATLSSINDAIKGYK
ncbi:MAG: hypothetical protein VXZ51_04830 [Actinomycetota bacterium]|nr:hypothetical protein [Actinomycetota bacterium]